MGELAEYTERCRADKLSDIQSPDSTAEFCGKCLLDRVQTRVRLSDGIVEFEYGMCVMMRVGSMMHVKHPDIEVYSQVIA